MPCVQGFRCWVLGSSQPDSQQEAEEQTPPIVFIHGVGLGVVRCPSTLGSTGACSCQPAQALCSGPRSPWTDALRAPVQLPYLHLLHKMGRACPRSQILLLELPAVSLRLNQRAPDVDAIADAAVAAAAQRARLPACFVGHSFGTFCVSRIIQLHPEAVQSVVRPRRRLDRLWQHALVCLPLSAAQAQEPSMRLRPAKRLKQMANLLCLMRRQADNPDSSSV